MEKHYYTNKKTERWYNNYVFPLVPVVIVRKADEDTILMLSFKWMAIKLETMGAFMFEARFMLNAHNGLGADIFVPYLRFHFMIPCPTKVYNWICKNLYRKPY